MEELGDANHLRNRAPDKKWCKFSQSSDIFIIYSTSPKIWNVTGNLVACLEHFENCYHKLLYRNV